MVSAADIPGKNHIALIETTNLPGAEPDQPRRRGDLAARPPRSRHRREGAHAGALEIDPLPPLYDLDESLARAGMLPCQGEALWGSNNTFKTFCIEKGDVDAAWARAEVVVEGDYETGAQERLSSSRRACWPGGQRRRGDRLGSLQCPYYIHEALRQLLDLPAEKVRVVQTETGGGSAAKKSTVDDRGACRAFGPQAGCPAKIIYDRLEDMVATTKRHPSRSHIKTGWSRDGACWRRTSTSASTGAPT